MSQRYPPPELLSRWRSDLLAYARSPWPRAYEADSQYDPDEGAVTPEDAAIAAKCSKTLEMYLGILARLTTPRKLEVWPYTVLDTKIPAAFVRFEEQQPWYYFDIELSVWHGDPVPRLRFQIELNYMRQLRLMTDEFWQALVEAKRWADLEFECEDNVSETDRLIWAMMSTWHTMDAREKATRSCVDGFDDVMFWLSAELPLSDDYFTASLEVFKRLYRAAYLLYQAEGDAAKSAPTEAECVEQ